MCILAHDFQACLLVPDKHRRAVPCHVSSQIRTTRLSSGSGSELFELGPCHPLWLMAVPHILDRCFSDTGVNPLIQGTRMIRRVEKGISLL